MACLIDCLICSINYLTNMGTKQLFEFLFCQNFIYKWDRSHSCSVTDVEKIRYESSVQLIFK